MSDITTSGESYVTPTTGWSSSTQSIWLTSWPIARTGLMLVLRRRLFWLLLGMALLNFLFLFATIYLKAQIASENPQVARFVDRVLSNVTGTGETYRDFMSAQGTVTMLLLAFAGTLLVGDDMRRGGLTFYLSRRLNPIHYVLGKLLAIGLLVSLTTTVPTLILYLEYGLLTDSAVYFRENLTILRGILGYGLVLSVTLSLLLFALAAWLQKTVPLLMSWSCLFVMVPVLANILRHVYDDRRWLLLMIWRDMRLVGTWCFGAIDTDRELQLLGPAAVIVAAVCAVAFVAILPRVRAVKVVR